MIRSFVVDKAISKTLTYSPQLHMRKHSESINHQQSWENTN